jgi:Transglycosylase SLT domain
MKFIFSFLTILAVAAGSATLVVATSMPKSTPTTVIATKNADGEQFAVLMPENVTSKQQRLMQIAKITAKRDGHSPELVQGVLLQETHAGELKTYKVANSQGTPYYGVMQIKLVAAKEVLSKWPGMFSQFGFQTKTDDEIKANLILNDEFNIAVGSKYLKHLKDVYGYSGRTLVNAYNRGPTGVKTVGDDYHYAIGAEQKVAEYRKR